MTIIQRSPHGKLWLVGLTLVLVVVGTLLAYAFTQHSVNRIADFADRKQEEERAREDVEHFNAIQDRLLNPSWGVAPEKLAAVSIGMTGDEVKQALEYPYGLGMEMSPYLHTFDDHHWVVHDIPVTDVGYIQLVFIDRQLVGIGSIDPGIGRLCGGDCLMNMLQDERDWLEGLPYQVEGKCPVCGSRDVLPFGSTLDQLQKELNR